MHVALTGATGFAGRAVTRQLLGHGHTVAALVRDTASAGLAEGVRAVEGDLGNVPALRRLMERAGAVVHLAGVVAAQDAATYHAVNETGTRNVATVARECGVIRFIHMSSLAAREPQLSPYAASKAAAERALHSMFADGGLVILRPSAIYGPGDKATLPLMQELMKRTAMIPGAATSRFSLIHVDDVAAIVADAVASRATGLFELDDTEGGHGWSDLANHARAAFGRPKRIFYVPRLLAMAVASAAELVSRLSGKPGMINTGKMRELYFPDWVVRGNPWPRANPILLRDGLIQTMKWYINAGLIVAPKGYTN